MIGRFVRQPERTRADGCDLCFVVSSPRSGTTWLKAALSVHPEVHCTEHRLFGRYCDTVQDTGRAEPRLRITLDRYVDSFMLHSRWQDCGMKQAEARDMILRGVAHTLADLSREMSGKRLVVDTVTPYVDTAGIVAESISIVFPGAAIIQLVRDGRDVLTSGVFHWITKQTEKSCSGGVADRRAARFMRGENVALDRFFDDDEVSEWCRLWIQPMEAVAALRKRHPAIRVTYEEMIEDAASSLARVFTFLDVDCAAPIVGKCVEESSFKKMSGGRERGQCDPLAHVRKGVVGDWRSYFTQQDGKLFHKLASKQLMKLGYENDKRWFNNLPDSLSL